MLLPNPIGHPCRDGSVSSGRGYWLLYVLHITHVTELWVARLWVWDQFRSMLTVNSTLLCDDPGLKHFNAQEWKRGTHRQLGLANGSRTCILRKMQKECSLMPLAIIKIHTQQANPQGFEPWSTQSRLPNVPYVYDIVYDIVYIGYPIGFLRTSWMLYHMRCRTTHLICYILYYIVHILYPIGYRCYIV